jgi:hypothetical protein
VAFVEPAVLVHVLEEAPDVFDVRVRERVVVVAPVHPLAETLLAAGELRRRPDDLLPAFARELREPVLLDFALGVQAQLALDADLDPESLAIEAVLIALVEAAQSFVPLEDVLERAPPGGVDAERLVGGHRAVDEAPDRTAPVLLAERAEDVAFIPPVEDLAFDRRMIGYGRKGAEHPRFSLRLKGCGKHDRSENR